MIGLTTGMRDSEIGRIKVSDIKYVRDENYFYLKAYNHKTEYYNAKETDEYRKIPLHPFVVEVLKLYIKENNIGKDDYIFGIPKLNEDTKKIDGYLDQSKTHKAIKYLYTAIKMREAITEGGIGIARKENEENIEKEMNDKRIVFYSLRHTFNTLCVLHRHNDTDLTRNDDLIDYFTGHNSGSKMRQNYTQINKADNKIFYNNYGKFVIDMLNKFIFRSEEYNAKLENAVDAFIDKKWKENKNLLNEDGKINFEDGIEKIIKPLIDTLRTKTTAENDDDVFISV
jgi:integrase